MTLDKKKINTTPTSILKIYMLVGKWYKEGVLNEAQVKIITGLLDIVCQKWFKHKKEVNKDMNGDKEFKPNLQPFLRGYDIAEVCYRLKNMTFKQIAAFVGLPVSTVYRYCRRKKKPRPKRKTGVEGK